ncbi:MAG: helix-turn-helix domain-containing protein [Comamonadaceae bacterium]|nr:MAG: helix-turn-helix domain-containing protein [Comamonadaceae bacterium]
MANPALPSKKAEFALKKLGQDVQIARKRRAFTQKRLADGAGISRATLQKVEAGDPGVSLGALAMVLLALGESDRLGQLLDVARDDVGLAIAIRDLPQRVRSPRSQATPSGQRATPNATVRPDVPTASSREPEVF